MCDRVVGLVSAAVASVLAALGAIMDKSAFWAPGGLHFNLQQKPNPPHYQTHDQSFWDTRPIKRGKGIHMGRLRVGTSSIGRATRILPDAIRSKTELRWHSNA